MAPLSQSSALNIKAELQAERVERKAVPGPLHDKTFIGFYSALNFEYSSQGRILNHFYQMPQRFEKSPGIVMQGRFPFISLS